MRLPSDRHTLFLLDYEIRVLLLSTGRFRQTVCLFSTHPSVVIESHEPETSVREPFLIGVVFPALPFAKHLLLRIRV